MSTDLKTLATGIAANEHQGRPQSEHGWQQVVRRRPAAYEQVTKRQYANLSPKQRRDYDQQRQRWHVGLDCIETTRMTQAMDAMNERLQTLNCGSTVARPGVMLSGNASAGKSTIVIEYGRRVELSLREAMKMPLPIDGSPIPRLDTGGEYLPVCYFSIATQAVPTLQNAVRFYNPTLPTSKRLSQNALLSAFVENVERCQTKLIILDQVQSLKEANVGTRAVSDLLKDVMDACPTTLLIGAGIGLDEFRVFSDGLSARQSTLAQTGTRFSLHYVTPYDLNNGDDKRDWARLLTSIERNLHLYDAQEGDLKGLSQHLYDLTGGLTGELMPLLRTAANEAIHTGTERITRTVLNQVRRSAARTIAENGKDKITDVKYRHPRTRPQGEKKSHLRKPVTA